MLLRVCMVLANHRGALLLRVSVVFARTRSEWDACVSCQQRCPPKHMLSKRLTAEQLGALAHPDLQWTLEDIPKA